MTNIGIVGAGIAGLHLGLCLRYHGVTATIYADHTSDQLRAGRIMNNPVRFDHTRARERALGVDHWAEVAPDLHTVQFYLGGAHPLTFTGHLAQPGSYVDMRLYQPTLLADFVVRGGEVVVGAVEPEDLTPLSQRHDLLVIAAGRSSLADLFPRLPDYSPYDRPQRRLCLGYFQGITADPHSVAFVIAPGQGEVFQTSTYTCVGTQTALLFEAILGGAFEVVTRMDYATDPGQFEATVLDLLRTYAPPIAVQIDPAAFRLSRPLDLLQGAVTPTVRRGYVQLDNGSFALAIGDIHVANDPLTAEGANTASHAAWILSEAIRNEFSADEAFCQRAVQRIWAYAQPVTEWSNFMLQPPPSHLVRLLQAATQYPAIADAFVDGFNTPVQTWELLKCPGHVAALLDGLNPPCSWG